MTHHTSNIDNATHHSAKKAQFIRRYRVFMRFIVRHFYVNPVSFVLNITLWLAIIVFVLFFNASFRDTLIKSYVLPSLEKFDLPKISYSHISLNEQHILLGSDIILYDKTKEKFLQIHHIGIQLNNFLNLSKGIHKINIDKITLYKSPTLPVSDSIETDAKPLTIPKIPFDIQELKIKHLVLKPALTNIKKDLNFTIKANHHQQNNLIELHLASLDEAKTALKSEITHNNNVIHIINHFNTTAPFLNDIIHNPYFKNDVAVQFNADIDLHDYLQDSKKPIKINADNISLTDKNLNLTGTIKTDFYETSLLARNTAIHLTSGKNSLTFTGDISDKKINGLLKANQFNLVEFYPLIDDLKQFTLDGDLKIKGDYTQIPNVDGDMAISAIYNTLPFNAKIIGKHNNTQSHIDFNAHYQQAPIVQGIMNMDSQNQGNLDLAILPQNIPLSLRQNIPVSSKDIAIKTDFTHTNNLFRFKNGHATIKNVKSRKNTSKISFNAQDIYFDFQNTPTDLSVKNAHLTAIINQQNFDVNMNTDLYDSYKPKLLILSMVNQNNASEKINAHLNHQDNLDIIDLDIQHLNLEKLLGKEIPVDISDLTTSFKGKTNLFAMNILETVTGTLTASAKHQIYDNHQATLMLKSDITKGNSHSDYQIFLNNIASGQGIITANHDFTIINVTTNTNLEPINIFIQDTEHRFKGQLKGNIDFNQQKLSGNLLLKQGTYENLLHGTSLENIDIQANLTHDAINITSLTAHSRPKGLVTGNGIVSLSPTVQSTFTVKTTDFVPLKDNMITVSANSDMRLIGNIHNLKLLGKINLNDLLILLPDLQANDTPKLNITRLSDDKIIQTEPISILNSIQTDIDVFIQEGAKITGFGLNGFPYGTLKIYDNLNAPSIDGQIQIARGKIELLNRNFKITKGGIFIKKTNPIFNIEATNRIDKNDINLTLKGTLESPDIILTSTPPLPKEEIIALLIFGKNKQQLSPFQALKLANTLYQLSRGKSGAGGTFDVVGKTERLLNIDELNIDSGDNNSVNIGAGKYVSDDIYVATDYNPSTTDTLFRIELKLTDTINLNTRINSSSKANNTNNSEIMLLKNKDY